jgi:hypothetical protein
MAFVEASHALVENTAATGRACAIGTYRGK